MKDHHAAIEFGRHWIDAWNRRDVESVLALFADDLVFTSPKARAITGNTAVTGKPALRAYWTQALEQIVELHFALESVLWDAERQVLAIRYLAALNGATRRAIEIFELDEAGKVTRGEALYGADC